MYHFSKSSLEELATCHPGWQKIMSFVIRVIDCKILCGHRNKNEQNKVYSIGRSKKKWPDSTHNTEPSDALDAVACPIDWADIEKQRFLAGVIIGVAICLGYEIRWGGDWDSDNDFKDQTFFDLFHFELILNKTI